MNRAQSLPTFLARHPLLSRVQILDGPRRHGNELFWRLGLGDDRRALLACLVEELACDPSVSRRYAQDVKRLAELSPKGVAPLLAWGAGDSTGVPPEETETTPPWRLRLEIQGERLEAWLSEHAPAPPDLVSQKLALLCDRLARLHSRGIVIRDLTPAKIVENQDGELWLIDVGLARTDILSTRTAASLVLEGSPYTAPEMLMRTAVDGRADLYAVGVLAFRALTGELPFGDTHALLRPNGPAPAPSTIRPGVPEALDQLIVQLLSTEPGQRPETAALVADILRGETANPQCALALLDCQNCGDAMPLGQRICLGCGKLAVQFKHAGDAIAPGERRKLVLRKAKEEGVFLQTLRETCDELCAGDVPPLNFLLGDARMYSKTELEDALRLPITLFNDLDLATAEALQERFSARDIDVEIERLDEADLGGSPISITRAQKRTFGVLAAGGGTISIGAMLAGAPLALTLGIAAGFTTMIVGFTYLGFRSHNKRRFKNWGRSLMALRAGPLALAASDPLVSRLATLMDREIAPDVAELVSHLALLVQRMADHRFENTGAIAEIELALSPLAELVTQVERRAQHVVELDRALAELDEGKLVRALAASTARGEDESVRAPFLSGLDQLRDLEVDRAKALSGLNQACDLARRSVEMGLKVQDAEAEHERRIRMAILALGPTEA